MKSSILPMPARSALSWPHLVTSRCWWTFKEKRGPSRFSADGADGGSGVAHGAEGHAGHGLGIGAVVEGLGGGPAQVVAFAKGLEDRTEVQGAHARAEAGRLVGVEVAG